MSGAEQAEGRTWLGRMAREPMAQFIAVALALFAVHSVVNGPEEPPEDVIVVSEGRIAQIAEGFRLLSGRPPGKAELEALVDDFVREEIAYREAVALGLDADDTVVRRRMRQKMEFLLEDMTAIDEPTDADLQALLDEKPEVYVAPERRAMRQVLSGLDARGEGVTAHASALLERVRAGADPAGLGDASMLPAALPLTTRQGVATLFGRDFADAVFATSVQGWFGPVQSAFGAHAVQIVEIEQPRAAKLDDVRLALRADWIEARRAAHRAEREGSIRKRYAVDIEWPERPQPELTGTNTRDRP